MVGDDGTTVHAQVIDASLFAMSIASIRIPAVLALTADALYHLQG
jgi:hypothetical protein